MDSLALPAALDVDVVPAGVSGVDRAHLNDVFAKLDHKIDQLARTVEAHRTYLAPQDSVGSRDARKCHMICKQWEGDTKLRCLQQCVRPVVAQQDLENLRTEFPVDLQRLDQDLRLRQAFERHQRAPDTIAATDAEASLIADVYAMPLATAALPETAWDRAMEVMRLDQFAPQRDALVRNWKDRASSYSPDAQEELTRKISRHDKDDVLLKASKKYT